MPLQQVHLVVIVDHHHQQKQIMRKPRKLPLLKLNSRKSIDEFSYEDMEIIGYDPHPHISAKVSI